MPQGGDAVDAVLTTVQDLCRGGGRCGLYARRREGDSLPCNTLLENTKVFMRPIESRISGGGGGGGGQPSESWTEVVVVDHLLSLRGKTL